MIPGFEDGLIGAKAGEEKTLNLTFPADYHAENLKGADVLFKAIQRRRKGFQALVDGSL